MGKIAICTHCNEPLRYNEIKKTWLHAETDKLTCTKIEFATPRRGSITKDTK